jgi:predicted hotdog family 3-hydroxylacyl-ACP dehydratase
MSAPQQLDRADIAAHIPHAGAMCLLDAVSEWDIVRLQARSTRHRDANNPLRHQGRLGASCAVEFAAQAMALHGALLAVDGTQQRPRAGFLASMREVRLYCARLDTCAEDLLIEVLRLNGDDNTVLYHFKLHGAQQLLVEGRAAVVLDADKTRKATP